MAETPSTMLALGTEAPDFSLPDVGSKKTVSLKDFEGAAGFLVMFICNHCPYVKHVMKEFRRLADDYLPRGIQMVAINSNSLATHPQDGPAAMEQLVLQDGWAFPFLHDESQSVARAYQAACTPDFFLFDGEKKLFYRGQLDGSRPGNPVPVTGSDLRAAMDAVLEGKEPPKDQKPSLGCSIKWHPGQEPDYS